MVSKFALPTNLLLASAALTAPSLEARLARRRANSQSHSLRRVDGPSGNTSNVEHSSNRAGAVWDEGDGTFTSVTGTFAVPTPTGSDGAASACGIDGGTCGNAILQTGVDFTISGGSVSYDGEEQ